MTPFHASFEHKRVGLVSPLLSVLEEGEASRGKILYLVVNIILIFIPLLVDWIISECNYAGLSKRVSEITVEIGAFLGVAEQCSSEYEAEVARIVRDKPQLKGNINPPEPSEEEIQSSGLPDDYRTNEIYRYELRDEPEVLDRQAKDLSDKYEHQKVRELADRVNSSSKSLSVQELGFSVLVKIRSEYLNIL